MTSVAQLEPTDSATRPDSSRRNTVLIVCGITLVALILRIAAFRGSFFGDELFTQAIATRQGPGDVLAGVRSAREVTPPLFFFVAWVFQKFGDPLIWLRVPSMIAGLATVPLVYVLGTRTVGRRAAVVGAGLFALSPMATFFAAEARAYALMMLLVVLSTLALLKALDTNEVRWWAAFALLVAAAMYTHYTCIFVLATQAGWAMFTRRECIRPLLAAYGAALVLYLPWVPSLLDDLKAPAQAFIRKIHPFGFTNAWGDIRRLVAGGPYAPLSQVPGTFALALVMVAAALAVGGLVVRSMHGNGHMRSRAVLVGLLALATPVGQALYAMVAHGEFQVRSLLASLPFVTLAFAALLVALPRKLAAIALSFTLIAFGIGAGSWRDPDAQRPAYAEIGDYVRANARGQDEILELMLLPGIPGRALRVQLPADIPIFTLRNPDMEAEAVRAAEQSGGRIFYVRPDNGSLHGMAPKQVEQRFRSVAQRHWGGAFPITVIVYEPSQ